MESNLYIGNLSFDTTEEELHALFGQAGSVSSVSLIIDRDTGRSKGFAFVEMQTPAEAQQAISKFDGSPLHDRPLKVNLARPREERGPGGARGKDSNRRP